MQHDRAPGNRPHSPESELRLRPTLRYALRYRGRLLQLDKTDLVLGRDADCDVVLSSPLVSRRHARLMLDRHGATIEDLGSRNGLFVNGALVEGPTRLSPGTRILLGHEALEFVAENESTPSGTVARVARPEVRHRETVAVNRLDPANGAESENTSTRSSDALELLAGAVERALAAGNADAAERVLGSHLERVMQLASSDSEQAAQSAERASNYAISIAFATGKIRWFEYPIRLYSTLRQPMPRTLLDLLSADLKGIRRVDRSLLRQYVAQLRQDAGRMTPEQRFLLQRIEGLERLAAL